MLTLATRIMWVPLRCLTALAFHHVEPDTKTSTIFASYLARYRVDDTLAELALWDMCGHKDDKQLRLQLYSKAHAVLLCFSIDAPGSLRSVKERV